MDKEEKLKKVIILGQQPNYIKPYVLFNFGTEIATMLAHAYNSTSALEKIASTHAILKSELKDEAKIKFIGDIMTRPRKERIAISMKLFKLLEEDASTNNN